MLRIVIGGARGTSPVAHAEFLEFGGETTSVLVEGPAGERVVLDAGTGIRMLGRKLKRAKEVLILFTHFHLDHVMGLPSFSVLYQRGNLVAIASPRRGEWTAEQTVRRIMDVPLWPLGIAQLGARTTFEVLPPESGAEPRRYGSLEIRWCSVHHPGGCTAYRIDGASGGGGSVVLATDLEWGAATADERAAFFRFLATPRPADALLFDGNYTRQELAKHVGWGHSSWEEGIAVAREGGVKRLFVIHHDPSAVDGRLRQIEEAVARELPGAQLARGGMEILSRG